MYQLAYFSIATKHFSETELDNLLANSKRNNQKIGVTGILLFIEGCFLQILEGQESAVKTLFNKVKKDRRHDNIFKIFEIESSQRHFQKWSMGFKNIPFVECKIKTGFEDISTEDFIHKVIKKNHPKIKQTLHNFYVEGL